MRGALGTPLGSNPASPIVGYTNHQTRRKVTTLTVISAREIPPPHIQGFARCTSGADDAHNLYKYLA